LKSQKKHTGNDPGRVQFKKGVKRERKDSLSRSFLGALRKVGTVQKRERCGVGRGTYQSEGADDLDHCSTLPAVEGGQEKLGKHHGSKGWEHRKLVRPNWLYMGRKGDISEERVMTR